ncbi:MAG: AAA family ATPase [Lachnospiraceae bacterium]|nr:AAA family ATPase [Lachnospiraceae bacterium]
MAEKIPAHIRHITLNDATFENTKQFVEEPTFINFFFGNNGTGKSTISKAIKNGAGVTYAPGKTAADYHVFLYDEEFIAKNFSSYHGMAGVYTLNSNNAKAQLEIEAQQTKLTDTRAARQTAVEEKQKLETAKETLLKDFQKECWNAAKDLREEFDKTQDQRRKSKQFTDAVLASAPKDADMDKLHQLYESAYSTDAQQYELFSTIPDTSVLDTVDGLDLLALAVVNIADTPYANFIKKIGATQWVREGHDKYAHEAGDDCPYCHRPLPDDFEKTLADSFDQQYEANLQKLQNLLIEYKRMANELFIPLQKTPAVLYPKIDDKSYREKLAAIRTTISLNIELITKKINDPATPVAYENVAPLLNDLMDIITAHNKLIQANNDIVAAGPKKKKECVEQVFSLIRFRLDAIIQAYRKSDADLAKEISGKVTAITNFDKDLSAIQAEIKRLSATTVETESAKEHINNMLRDSGMQGFHLEPHETTPHVYKVVRDDGTIADTLSEGEKNFIAFLYFYYMVQGSTTPDADPREKIVVIDDPVSSMDSNSLFIISTLVRNMIEVCRNNADNRDPVAEGNYIKQLFILTHNAYFHREITYNYVGKYDYVSFYLIRKKENCSSVKLFREVDPKCPTQMRNVNPVRSSYAALWEEYHECRSSLTLISVTRKILEYYFLQLCGYDGTELRKTILVDNRHFFKDEAGNEDKEQFDLAQSMLAYISPERIGFNDGLHYVEESADPDVCRDIFHKIFTIMRQEQHYKMMYAVYD